MAEAAGWLPDPDRADLQRYWDGSAWTDRVRSAGRAGSASVAGHAPDLHRALSAATADLDAVEDRLSTMFDRTPAGQSADSAPGTAPPPTRHDDGPDDGPDAEFAELDAALAAEGADEPDGGSGNRKSKGRHSMFRRRRRAKGGTPTPG